MAIAFYIDISVRTAKDLQRFGRFELGNDREMATELFEKLKGSAEIDSRDMLYIELMETASGLPVNIKILTCNLQELGTNVMLITQEIFRVSNLKAGN
jgi:hypothetical protein